MKSSLRLLGWLVACAASGYFIWFLVKTIRTQDMSALTSLPVIGAIVLAAVLYSLIIPITGAAWSLLLQRQGESWAPLRLAAIMGVAQIGKYIPGNIAQIVGRASLSLRQGMKLRTFTISVVYETALTAAASTFVGLGLYLMSPAGVMLLTGSQVWIFVGGAVAATSGVILLARGPSLLPLRLRAHRRISRALDAIGSPLGVEVTTKVFIAYCVNYLLIGIGIWCIGVVLGISTPHSYALLTGAFSLAWVLGYVTPGAPAGMGVREGMLALLLERAIPGHLLLTLIVATRVATLAGDGICFCVGLWGMRAIDVKEQA